MMNFRKALAFGGISLLFLQALSLSFQQVSAETDAPVEEQTLPDLRAHTPGYLNLSNPIRSPEVPAETVQEFSFVAKTFRTTVSQSVILRFTSTLPANEVLVRIPIEGQVLEDQFSNGESIQHSHGEYWILKTSSQQTVFELPVAVETAGQYFFTVDHDADHFYLEVEEAVEENKTEQRKDTEEIDVLNETEEVKDQVIDVQPILAKEDHLAISEELIAMEDARILEEITDPQNRSQSNVSNWSGFRSAWNSSSTTVINFNNNIQFSSSILGDSLNVRSSDIVIEAALRSLGFLASSNVLEMNGTANLTVRRLTVNRGTGSKPFIKHNGNGLVDMNDPNAPHTANQPLIEAQNINLSGWIRAFSGANAPVISVVRGGTLTLFSESF